MLKMSNLLLVSQFVMLLFADILASKPQLLGGYSALSPTQYASLKSDLNSSNLYKAMNETDSDNVRVIRIIKAQKQVVAGMNYEILAEVANGCDFEICCIKAFRSLQRDFSVCCADCGPESCQYQPCMC